MRKEKGMMIIRPRASRYILAFFFVLPLYNRIVYFYNYVGKYDLKYFFSGLVALFSLYIIVSTIGSFVFEKLILYDEEFIHIDWLNRESSCSYEDIIDYSEVVDGGYKSKRDFLVLNIKGGKRIKFDSELFDYKLLKDRIDAIKSLEIIMKEVTDGLEKRESNVNLNSCNDEMNIELRKFKQLEKFNSLGSLYINPDYSNLKNTMYILIGIICVIFIISLVVIMNYKVNVNMILGISVIVSVIMLFYIYYLIKINENLSLILYDREFIYTDIKGIRHKYKYSEIITAENSTNFLTRYLYLESLDKNIIKISSDFLDTSELKRRLEYFEEYINIKTNLTDLYEQTIKSGEISEENREEIKRILNESNNRG